MRTLDFRTLKADEMEVRVGNTIKKEGNIIGFTLLLYKTARVDAIILDETVGAFNWQKKYYQVKNTMVCSIGIYDEERKEWVWKDDGGDDDSQMEKVKSELSDSQKRSAFVWGIGRELYFGPKITIWTSTGNSERDYYSVKSVEFDKNKNMVELTIINESKNGQVAFQFKNGKQTYIENQNTSQNAQNQPKSTIGSGKGTIRDTEKALIKAMLESKTIDECNGFYNWLDKHFGTMNYEMLSDEQGVMVCKRYKLM